MVGDENLATQRQVVDELRATLVVRDDHIAKLEFNARSAAEDSLTNARVALATSSRDTATALRHSESNARDALAISVRATATALHLSEADKFTALAQSKTEQEDAAVQRWSMMRIFDNIKVKGRRTPFETVEEMAEAEGGGGGLSTVERLRASSINYSSDSCDDQQFSEPAPKPAAHTPTMTSRLLALLAWLDEQGLWLYSLTALSYCVVSLSMCYSSSQSHASFEGTILFESVAEFYEKSLAISWGVVCCCVPYIVRWTSRLTQITDTMHLENRRAEVIGQFWILIGIALPSMIDVGVAHYPHGGLNADKYVSLAPEVIEQACVFYCWFFNFSCVMLVTGLCCKISWSRTMHCTRPCVLLPLLICMSVSSLWLLEHDLSNNETAAITYAAHIPFYVTGFCTLCAMVLHGRTVMLEINNSTTTSRRALETSVTIFNLILLYAIIRFFGADPYASERESSFGIWSVYNLRFCVFLLVQMTFDTSVTNLRLRTFEETEKTKRLILRIEKKSAEAEREVVVKLLHSLVPPKIALDLSRGVPVLPEMEKFAAIFFSDMAGFTSFAAKNTPLGVFTMLDRLFCVMDAVVQKYPSLYKMETCGDGYLVVGGILRGRGDDEDDDDDDDDSYNNLSNGSRAVTRRNMQCAREMCKFALEIRSAVRLVPFDEQSCVQIRIGVHYGPVVTGLCGSIVPRFSCFGDTINTASRMESTGQTGKVHVSLTFRNLFKHTHRYVFEKRAPIEVKGKGQMQTFFMEESAPAEGAEAATNPRLSQYRGLIADYDSERYAYATDGTIVLSGSSANLSALVTREGANNTDDSNSNSMSAGIADRVRSKPALFHNQAFSRAVSLPASPTLSTATVSAAAEAAMSETSQSARRSVVTAHNLSTAQSQQTHDILAAQGPKKYECFVVPLSVDAERGAGSPSSPSAKEQVQKAAAAAAAAAAVVAVGLVSHESNRRDRSFSTDLPCCVPSASELLSLSFDVLSVSPADFGAVALAIDAVFVALLGDLGDIGVDLATLGRLVRRVGLHYHPNPYHNYHHAFCVVQGTAALLEHFCVTRRFTQKDVFVILLAALIHDVDHGGTNNLFEVNSRSTLAVRYNDQSVLENHHIAFALALMSHSSLDVFHSWTIDEQTAARKMLIGDAFDWQSAADLQKLANYVVHAADIGNATRAFESSSLISLMVCEEFNCQAVKERQLGLPVTAAFMVLEMHEAICRCELGFLTFVARPYFQALIQCFPLQPSTHLCDAIEANFQGWTQQLQYSEFRHAAALTDAAAAAAAMTLDTAAAASLATVDTFATGEAH